MFEKEAKEYFENECLHSYADTEEELKEDVVAAFKDGAEFGYNKGKEDVKTTILKLRNCMNCKHRDVGDYTSCEVIGVVLCNHWEMKE